MTAYLRPGDQIHIAFPVSGVLYGREAEAEAKRLHDEFTALYARLGVNIVQSTGSSQLTTPVVVAVFRAAPEEETR